MSQAFKYLEKKSLITDGMFFDIKIHIFLHMAVNEKSVSLINSDAHAYWLVSVGFFSVKYSGFMILTQFIICRW